MSTGQKSGNPNGSTGKDAKQDQQQPAPLGARAVTVIAGPEEANSSANQALPFFRIFHVEEHLELACVQAVDGATAISRIAMVAHLLPRQIRHAAYDPAKLEARPRKPGRITHSAQFTDAFFACYHEAMSLRNGRMQKVDPLED